MTVTAQQLHKGGNVFYKVQIPRPGAPAEVRLKAARVIDVERGAARIRLLEDDQTFKVRFANLAPDVDYLATRERERPARPDNAWPEDELAPAPATAPTALEAPARRPSARPLTHTLRDQLKHVDLENVHALRGPVVANEQAEPTAAAASTPPPPPPPSEGAAQDDMQAWLEIGKDLRAEIDRKILTAPRSQVPLLMAQRKQLEMELQAKERGELQAKEHTEPAEQKAAEPQTNEQRNPHSMYSPTRRDEVLKDHAAGMKPPAIAKKHKVPYSTVAQWIRAAKGLPVKSSKRPPARATENVTARKAPAVRPYSTTTPGVALATLPTSDGSHTDRENRRLRAMLGALLTRPNTADTDAVAAQNRQLQNVLDQLLGVE